MSFSKEGSSTGVDLALDNPDDDDFMTLVSNMISEASTSPEEANELKEWIMSQDEVVDALRRVDSDDVRALLISNDDARASLISGLMADFGRSNKKDSASINDEAADGEEANTEDHGDEEENTADDASSSRASDSPKESENASPITTEYNLCHVLESKEPDDLILPLINAASAKEKDDDGHLPLHIAVRSKASLAVVKALLEAHPEAAKDKKNSGWLPLHYAARYEASEAVVITLLDTHPEAAKKKSNTEYLPLHVAAQFNASAAVVKALLEVHPEAAKERNYDWDLPLHLAIKHVASEALVKALLKAHPETAEDKGAFGYLPLHYAARYKASEAVIITLLEVYPEAAKETTDNRYLPLHLAAIYKASEAVVKALLEVHPEAAKKRNNRDLPLHLAIRYGAAPPAVVEALLEAHPEAAKEKDDDGDLPLHCAIKQNASEAVVKALLICAEGIEFYFSTHDGSDKSPTSLCIEYPVWEAATTSNGFLLMLIHNALRDYLRGPENATAAKKDALRKSLNENRNEEGSPLLHLVAAQGSDEALTFCKLLADEIGADFDKVTDRSGRTAHKIAAANSNAETGEWAKSVGAFLGRYRLAKGPPIHISRTSVVIKAEDVMMNKYYEVKFEEYKDAGSLEMNKSNFRRALQAMNRISDKETDNNEKLANEFFHKVDTDKPEAISTAEFVLFCSGEFGRNVALKFMRKKEQFKRELKARKGLNGKYVIEIIRSHDLSSGSEDQAQPVARFLGPYLSDNHKPEDYRHLIVMPFGDSNLDTIFRSERPDAVDVRSIMKQVGESLAHLHEHRLVHGDVKMLNIVRTNQRYVLIDLDASARKGDDIGSKFSSGILPPEMIYRLADFGEKQMFDEYYANEDADEKLKTQPKFSTDTDPKIGYVVKSFSATERKEEIQDVETGKMVESNSIVPRDRASLPYKLQKAECSMDVWSFGVLLYALCTDAGECLFPVNRDDDIKDGENTGNLLMRLEQWDDRDLKSRLKLNIRDAYAQDLLLMILQKNPKDLGENHTKRPTMNDVLAHHFFHPSRQENTDEALAEIRDKLEVLDKNAIENREIMRKDFLAVRKSLKRVHERQQAANTMLKDIIKGMFIPQCFVILPTEKTKGVKHFFNKLASPKAWVNNKFLLVFYCPILRRAVNGPDGKAIGYEIELPREWVKKYGPAIVFGLKILEASLVIGRLCGLPIPTLGGAANDAENKLVEASNFVENMQEVLLEEVGNEGDKSLAGILVSKFDAATEEVLGELESSKNPLSDIQQEETQKSFHEIGALIGDKEFKHCGLKQVIAKDGTTEFVHPDIASYFEEHGQDCFDRVDEMEDVASRQRAMNQDQAAGSGRRETLVRTDAVRGLE